MTVTSLYDRNQCVMVVLLRRKSRHGGVNAALFKVYECLILCRILANTPNESNSPGCAYSDCCLVVFAWHLLNVLGFCGAGFCIW